MKTGLNNLNKQILIKILHNADKTISVVRYNF